MIEIVPNEHFAAQACNVIRFAADAAEEGESFDSLASYNRGRLAGIRTALFFLTTLTHAEVDALIEAKPSMFEVG